MSNRKATIKMSAPTAHCRLTACVAAMLTLAIVASPWPDRHAAAQSQKPIVKPVPGGGQKSAAASPGKAEQSIVVLVNDEPVTAYEIEQRARFIALSSGGAGGPDLKAKAQARWAQIIQDPKTSERFQQLVREKNVRTREEAEALQ